MACLTADDVAGGRSQLGPENLAHLTECRTCALRVAGSHVPPGEADATPFVPRSGSAEVTVGRRSLGQGDAIGRFLVLGNLGEGGMGVVYAAYDPSLNRRVALKLVRVEHSAGGSDARMRLVREAQALAQLSHPSVVAVYEVGYHEGDVFIAMELVDGQSLREWLKGDPRPWREVLEVCIAAGRGLAAAHAAGLVHRDFKPANVLVGNDGRVRVMDFGLARASSDVAPVGTPSEPPPISSESDSSFSGGLLHLHVTQHGAVLGTPAYMAPEQFAGSEADASSDQYAFCISVFEALYGHRPDKNDPFATPPPRGSRVPARIHAVLCRGLQAAPDARFPSMDALLEALESNRAGRKNRLLLAAAGVLLVAGASFTVAWQREQRQLCTGAERELVGIWDPARRAGVERSLLATSSYAPGVWDYIRPKLDAYAQDWIRQHTGACEATSLRGEVSAEVLDLRMACLHRARVKLDAVVDVLESSDAKAMQKAHQVVDGLDVLTRCEDVEGLRAEVAPPAPHEADSVERARRHLAQAAALRSSGRYPQAKDALAEATSAARDATYGPLVTELSLERGQLLGSTGEYDAALVAMRAGLESAARWKQWKEVRRAATLLLFLIGNQLRRPQEALHYVELARGLVVGQGDPAAEALFRNHFAAVLDVLGKPAEAEAELRQALSLQEGAFGSEHPAVAHVRNNLALALWSQGRYRESEAELRVALRMRLKTLGPEHPDVAATLDNVGVALYSDGKYEESAAEHLKALTLREKVLGPEHPSVTISLSNYAIGLRSLGRTAEAEAAHRRVLALRIKLLAQDHPQVAQAHHNLGEVLLDHARFKEAESEFRRALGILEKRYGPDHPDLGYPLTSLGKALHAQRRLADAEPVLRRAVAAREKAFGADHPQTATARVQLGQVLLDWRREGEALKHAELAWRVQQRDDIQKREQAESAFLLAQALWATGGEKDRARALAARAEQGYGDPREVDKPRLNEIRTWLKRNR